MRAPAATTFSAPAPLGPAGESAFALDLVPTPQGGAAATWAAKDQIRAAVQPAGGAFGDGAAIAPSPTQVTPQPEIAVAPSGLATVIAADPATGALRAIDVGGGTETIGYVPVEQPGAVAVAASADRTVAVWRDASGALSAATRSEQAPPSTGPGPKPAGPDKTRPKVTLLLKSKRINVTTKTRSVSFKVRCNESCSIFAMASMRTTAGKKRKVAPLRTFKSKKPTSATQTVTLKLGSFGEKDLRSALKRGRGASVFVDMTATDAASNSTRVRLELTLRKAAKKRR